MYAGNFILKIKFVQELFMNKTFYFYRDAAMMGMRRVIADLEPEQIKQLSEKDFDMPVTKQDFMEAIMKTNRSVSNEDVVKYTKWMQEFGAL